MKTQTIQPRRLNVSKVLKFLISIFKGPNIEMNKDHITEVKKPFLLTS